MFQSIEIENLKGIEKLKLDNFKRVNLITGKNNTSKTSILQALFVLFGIENPKGTLRVFYPFEPRFLRDREIDNSILYEAIFTNLDTTKTIQITSENQSSSALYKVTTAIKAILSDNVNKMSSSEQLNMDLSVELSSLDQHSTFEGLNFATILYKNNLISDPVMIEKNIYIDYEKDRILGRSNRLEQHQVLTSNLLPETGYISAFFTGGSEGLAERVDSFQKKKNNVELIDILKQVDNRIIDIKIGANNTLLFDIGLESLVPLQIMGDGIYKILRVATTIPAYKNGILLIDEIDNGLHWTSLKILWQVVYRSAELHNVQIFATTHSQECIDAAIQVKDQLNQSDLLSLYNLKRYDVTGELTAVHYDAKRLHAAQSLHRDLR